MINKDEIQIFIFFNFEYAKKLRIDFLFSAACINVFIFIRVKYFQ